MTSTTTEMDTTGTLAHPYRRDGVWALFPLPAWLGCFSILYSGALGARVVNDLSVGEQAAYYQSLAPLGIWAFTLGALVAITLLGVAVVSITRITRATSASFSVVALVIAVASTVTEWVNSFVIIGLLSVDPSAVPQPLEVLGSSTANHVMNGVSWSGFVVSTVIVAFLLYRGRVLPRVGLVVAILGAVFLAGMVVGSFYVPMVAALLLFVLGVALVRRRA